MISEPKTKCTIVLRSIDFFRVNILYEGHLIFLNFFGWLSHDTNLLLCDILSRSVVRHSVSHDTSQCPTTPQCHMTPCPITPPSVLSYPVAQQLKTPRCRTTPQAVARHAVARRSRPSHDTPSHNARGRRATLRRATLETLCDTALCDTK